MHGKTLPPEFLTERLILRGWRNSDREPFAAMCADRRVMEFLPKPLSRQDCDAYIDATIAHHAAHGFCFWALQERATGAFAGLTGLRRTTFDAHFTPAVEFGWRLPVAFWGRGLASEAARACLACGFGVFELPEIVAVVAPGNLRSQAVMQRIGMSRDLADDFIYPLLAADHRLQPCALYRISAPLPHPQHPQTRT